MSAPQFHAEFSGPLSQRLQVGLLCPHNPHDRSSFSGAPYHAARALSAAEGVTLRIIGGHRPLPWHDRLTRRLRERPVFAPRPAEFADLDIVVGLVATGHLLEARAFTDVPLVHVTDATPDFLREHYGHSIPREADLAEAKALSVARLAVYSSDYMARRAVEEFGPQLRRKVAALPFGANCALPLAPPAKPAPAPLRLLWVGSRWERKGGEIALAAFDILRAHGLDVELSMVGDVPGDVRRRPGLHVVGWLDKNRPAEAAQLADLFAAAHLFVLPTRADCTPMVVAEAGARATPVLVTDVGGVGSLVAEGVNGRMLPPEADPTVWAQAIRELTCDPVALAALGATSFVHVRDRLSWDAWAAALVARLRMEIADARVAAAAA